MTRKISALLLVAMLVGTVPVFAQKSGKLESQAKVSKEEATKTALARVPGGTVKEAELEKEKGKLVWSFDIATANSKDITEVQVDAITGKVVSVEKESPSAEAAEKRTDRKK